MDNADTGATARAGEHLVPAAATRFWEALADPETVARALPPSVTLDWADGSPRRLHRADGGAVGIEVLAVDPARSVRLRLAGSDPAGGLPTGELVATLLEDGAFTRVGWRWSGDAAPPEALRASIDDFLNRIGQHAATPTTVAAEGFAGIAVAAADTVATPLNSSRRSPLAPLLARVRAWPRDLAIGGALFAVVLLIVIGVL